MRLSVSYLNDAEGNVEAVQLPASDWKRVLKILRERKQELKIKSDIRAGLKEVEQIRSRKKSAKTLQQFLSEL